MLLLKIILIYDPYPLSNYLQSHRWYSKLNLFIKRFMHHSNAFIHAEKIGPIFVDKLYHVSIIIMETLRLSKIIW